MFPFSEMALREKVLENLEDKTKGKTYGWAVYKVDRSGRLSYKAGFPNKFPIPGLLVEYWVSPEQTDWVMILNGLLRACKKSGEIALY